jgi:hypothetical protein
VATVVPAARPPAAKVAMEAMAAGVEQALLV